MQPETARWLNESRVSLGAAAQSRFNDISSMDVTGAGALFMSAEYAVKAVIVEHYGFLPPSFMTHHRIVNLSHLIGGADRGARELHGPLVERSRSKTVAGR